MTLDELNAEIEELEADLHGRIIYPEAPSDAKEARLVELYNHELYDVERFTGTAVPPKVSNPFEDDGTQNRPLTRDESEAMLMHLIRTFAEEHGLKFAQSANDN